MLIVIAVLLAVIVVLLWYVNKNIVDGITLLAKRNNKDNTDIVLLLRGIKAGVLSLDDRARK